MLVFLINSSCITFFSYRCVDHHTEAKPGLVYYALLVRDKQNLDKHDPGADY